MNRALVIDAAVRNGDIVVCDAKYESKCKRAAEGWGDGTALKMRIEPEEDAYTYAQLKHYWGFVVDPFSQETGYHKHEAHLMLKAECMPEGKTSITELNRDELRAYTEAAEQTARRWCPEAFVLYDNAPRH